MATSDTSRGYEGHYGEPQHMGQHGGYDVWKQPVSSSVYERSPGGGSASGWKMRQARNESGQGQLSYFNDEGVAQWERPGDMAPLPSWFSDPNRQMIIYEEDQSLGMNRPTPAQMASVVGKQARQARADDLRDFNAQPGLSVDQQRYISFMDASGSNTEMISDPSEQGFSQDVFEPKPYSAPERGGRARTARTFEETKGEDISPENLHRGTGSLSEYSSTKGKNARQAMPPPAADPARAQATSKRNASSAATAARKSRTKKRTESRNRRKAAHSMIGMSGRGTKKKKGYRKK